MSFFEQLDFLDKLNEYIKKQAASIVPQPDKYQSNDIQELAASLAKAHAEYPEIIFNRTTNYFQQEYTDFDNIMKVIRPVLSKNGLSLVQWTELSNTGESILHTEILHSSGQWKETRTRFVPSKNDIRTASSAFNHIKKNQAMALLNITIADDPMDDNAEAEMASNREIYAKGTAPRLSMKQKDESYKQITKEQLEELEYELSEYPDIAEEILNALNLQSLADMPSSKYRYSVTKVREIKQLRNEGALKK